MNWLLSWILKDYIEKEVKYQMSEIVDAVKADIVETKKDVQRLADAFASQKPVIEDLKAKVADLETKVADNAEAAAALAEIKAGIEEVDAIAEGANPEPQPATVE